MLKVHSFTFNPFQENTYVVSRENGDAIIIDPGNFFPEENQEIENYIEENSLKPVAIYNTHAHIDHVMGINHLKAKYDIPLYIHEKDLEWLRALVAYAPRYGFENFEEVLHDGLYDENDKIFDGEDELEVLFLPGHSPGHTALVNHAGKFVIAGDVLFDGSIGRTDLPGGDHDTLISSIQDNLFKLPEDYEVHCGHGPSTTIGKEMATNPFCAVK